MIAPADLLAVLPEYLARQRWYGGKNRAASDLRITAQEELWPGLERLVVEVGTERYQLLLGTRPLDGSALPPDHESDVLGVVPSGAGQALAFDALGDADLSLALLPLVAPGQEAQTVRAVGVDQSNTSLVYDERLILKVFRRLAGSNPEIEVTLALADRGFDHVAAPVAVWRGGGDDLAIVQRFLGGAVEGWALALTSIRAVLAEGVEPGQAGADLAPEARRLGTMTAELHLALAEAFGARPADPGGWADTAAARAADVDHPDVDVAAAARVFDRIRALPDAGRAIRIHGDYHLGQVIRTDEGWFVLDFEGEPSRPVAERTRPSSPLRDVAGLLRSLSYAAAVGGRDHQARPDGGPEIDVVAPLAAAWEARNRAALLGAYLERLEGSPIVPADPSATELLLAAFELDKAVYEVGYEQAHRPDWADIPLGAVRRLVGRPR